MSGKLQSSVSSRGTAISDSSRASSVSSGKVNFCTLFSSCFRISRKKKSLEEITENDVKHYDYVVEKLVVKRVPFVLFSIPKDPLDDKTTNFETKVSETNSSKDALQPFAKLNAIYSTGSKTQSLLYYSDRFNLDTPNKCLHFDKSAAIRKEKNRKQVLSNVYCARITKLINTMSTLHPDLKKDERPPEDPCHLNMPKSMNTSSTKLFLKGFLNKSNNDKKEKTFTSQTFVEDSFSKNKELENSYSSEIQIKNDQKIYVLNQMEYMNLNNLQNCKNSDCKFKEFTFTSNQEITHNSTCTKPITNESPVNVEDYSRSNGSSQCNQQLLISESKPLPENITKTDLSDPILLKWNIIVKHYKSKTHSSEIFSKNSKYFNTN